MPSRLRRDEPAGSVFDTPLERRHDQVEALFGSRFRRHGAAVPPLDDDLPQPAASRIAVTTLNVTQPIGLPTRVSFRLNLNGEWRKVSAA